jgi:hypothetical protein
MKKLFYRVTVLISLFLTQLSASEDVEAEMKNKTTHLGKNNSFVYVNLGITNNELELIERLKFDHLKAGETVQYDRFGELQLLEQELPYFLKNIGDNDELVINATTKVIARLVQQVVNASNKNTAWVCVRASTPTPTFDIPRWHIDGQYYGFNRPSTELVFKFAAALKGNSTLLYDLPANQRDLFFANMDNRNFLSEFLDLNKAESPKKGEGVFFIVANKDMGAVHSEPKIQENRLFFSILVGDESDIEELYLRWHPQ